MTKEMKKIETEALETIDALHRRYATYSAFPARPVRFLRNLLESRENSATVLSKDVIRAFSDETGLPIFLLDDRETLDIAATEKRFNDKVIGQTEAVELISDLIATVKARLTRPKKPIASLLFIGQTGVGKTEMVKTLAEFFFRDASRMIRFDMSEFSNPLAVKRLIGGVTESEGLLTAKMREQPFAVILFDEFEKAHSSFFDLLLQILGEGRLTDSAGRVADFTNAIIVMTSNLGAESYRRGKSGFRQNGGEKREAVRHFTQSVREFLRPEIFNRIDRIVPFAPLDKETVQRIAELEIEKAKRRDGIFYRGVNLEIEPQVTEYLALRGYDARYGARPLRRTIERELLVPLGEKLNLLTGEEKLKARIWLENDALKFEVLPQSDAKKRTSQNFLIASLANRVAELRRKFQKFATNYHLSELQNELFQLVKIEDRIQRKKFVADSDAARLARLPIIQHLLDLARNATTEIAALEDAILLELYGKTTTENPDFGVKITKLEKVLEENLFALLALQYEKPDEITIGVFSENTARLFQLARFYRLCAESLEFEITQISALTAKEQKDLKPVGDLEGNPFPVLGRTIWEVQISDAKKFFAEKSNDVVCILLQIKGELANPRFTAENGLHVFANESRKDRVLTLASEATIADYLIPRELSLRGSIGGQLERRIYDAAKLVVKDHVLQKEFPFDGQTIATETADAIEEALKQKALAVIS